MVGEGWCVSWVSLVVVYRCFGGRGYGVGFWLFSLVFGRKHFCLLLCSFCFELCVFMSCIRCTLFLVIYFGEDSLCEYVDCVSSRHSSRGVLTEGSCCKRGAELFE